MHFVIALLTLAAILYGPQLWVRAVMARHGRDRSDIPGTGGQLAEHLLQRFGLPEVRVEPGETGDHFDPERQVVVLSEPHFRGRSLTAVAVAAHEVGHALQDQSGYRPLRLRHRLVQAIGHIQRAGAMAIAATPFLFLLTRSPAGLILPLAVGLGGVAAGVAAHLVTLPVELDASFRRALPILRNGYLSSRDEPAARQVLSAAALTYVAAALASVVNLWFWLRLLGR